tara:strand:+ start:253 stop:831 length:579 start_codon:yes stop_codon:yes gene_type:complete
MADKVKIVTKVQSFEDVQKSLQNIENQFNKLLLAVNKKAESKQEETKGSSGDIQSVALGTDAGRDYSLEIKTNKGWQNPILNPHYDSGWVAVAKDTNKDFKHNLNSKMLLLAIYVKDSNNNILYLGADSFVSDSAYEGGISIVMHNLNTINIGTGNDAIFIHDNTTLGISVADNKITSGSIRILAWKTGLTR